MNSIISLVLWIGLIWLYMVPSTVAYKREHPWKEPILVVNIFLGWTVVGWVLCLAFAVWRKEGDHVGTNNNV